MRFWWLEAGSVLLWWIGLGRLDLIIVLRIRGHGCVVGDLIVVLGEIGVVVPPGFRWWVDWVWRMD